MCTVNTAPKESGGGRRCLQGDDKEQASSQEGKLASENVRHLCICCLQGEKLLELNRNIPISFFFFSLILISAKHKLPHTGNPEW